MSVVADASLALKWVFTEEFTEEARTLLGLWKDEGELVIAPSILGPEVTNAIYGYIRRGHLTVAAASDALDALLPLVAIAEPAGLYRRALGLAAEFTLTATYDALYLALAELEDCEVWTADRRLVRSVQRRFPLVRWVGEVA